MNDAAPTPTFRELATSGGSPTLEQFISEGLGIIRSEGIISGPDYSLERLLGDLTAREIVRLQSLLEQRTAEHDAVVKEQQQALRRVKAALTKAGNY